MNLQIDTTAKSITILEPTPFKELAKLVALLGGDFNIISKVQIKWEKPLDLSSFTDTIKNRPWTDIPYKWELQPNAPIMCSTESGIRPSTIIARTDKGLVRHQVDTLSQ